MLFEKTGIPPVCLFSDSILKNEGRNAEDLVKDVSFSNNLSSG